jgi:extracellular matrix regulatory protein B
MFLHLGAATIIPLKDVISITDIKNGKSDINKEFLDLMVEESMIEDVSDDNPKCFIVTEKIVYISAISSTTLKKRAENMRCVGDEIST